MPASGSKYDVFLSHNSADKQAVEAIATMLLARGVRPFLDKWNLIPGTPWQEGLEEALDASSACAVFLGPSGVSPWQNEEMRAALEQRARDRASRVIPVLLPGAVPEADTVPRFLRRLTWCDFRPGLDDAEPFRRLLAGISGEAPGPIDAAEDLGNGAGTAFLMPDAAGEADGTIQSVDVALLRLRAMPYAWTRRSMLDPMAQAMREGKLPLILRGLRGIGKTTLLGQIAVRLRGEFPHVLAISLDGPARVEPTYVLEELNAFLTSLDRGIDLRQARGRDHHATFEALLERFLGLRLLVLVDAVDLAVPECQKWLLAELPALPTVRISATVQDRSPPGIAATVLLVPPLAEDEAEDFVAEMARVHDVVVDPSDLISRLPAALATHPQALTTLLAHLRDLPFELLLLEGFPEDTRAPAIWVEQTVASMDEHDQRVLALVDALGGIDLPSALNLLDLPLPEGFQSSLRLLLARSLVMRTGPVMEVPALVSEGLRVVEPGLVAGAFEQVAEAVAAATKQPFTVEEEAETLAAVSAQVAVRLTDAMQWGMLLEITSGDFLDLLNLRGQWKEYAVLLRLGLQAAAILGRRETQVDFGCRLARKLPQMGDPLGGREALRHVEQLIGTEGDTLEHAELYSHRALVCWADDDEEAIRELVRSRSIREAHGDRAGLVVVYKLIGNVYLGRGDYQKARAAYEEGLAIEPVAGREKHRLESEMCVALCDLNEGQPGLAEQRLRGVVERMRRLRYDAGQPKALFGLALALERLGEPDQALAAAREAVSLATGDPQVARAVEVLAWRLETSMTFPEEDCARSL
jgi:tetratricopeptide (TPR) repeat protein